MRSPAAPRTGSSSPTSSAASCARRCGATSRRSSAPRPSRSCRSSRAASRSRSAPSARRPSSSAGSTSARSTCPGRSTASTSTRSRARGIVWDYKSGKKAHSAVEIERELRLQIPLYMLVLRDLVGVEPLGGLYRPLSGDRKARGLLRATAKDDGVPGYSTRDYVDEDDFWAKIEKAQDAARGIVAAHPRRRRQARPARGHVPVVVPARLDVQDQEGLMATTAERPPTPEQHAAIEAEGLVFVSAGAGTGKTSVLVERFARAIDQRHRRRLDPGDHVHRAGRRRAARPDQGAARRARPARADARARRRVDLDDPRLLPAAAQAAPVRRRARPALPGAGREPGCRAPGGGIRRGAGRVLLAASSPTGSACSPPTARRRSGGCSPASTRRCAPRAGRSSSSLGDAPGLDDAIARVRAAAGDADEAARLVELLDRRPVPESLLDLSGYAVKRDDDYEQARKALEQAALNVVAARDRALLEELLQAFERSYQAAKDRESALDFEDLQLRARNLLRDDDRIREQEQLRFRQVCVDEFQDTNRLQCEVIDLIAARRALLRRRRVPVDLPLPARRRRGLQGAARGGRRRPAAHRRTGGRGRRCSRSSTSCSAPTFGDEFQRLVAAGRFPDPASGPAVELLVTDKASYKDTGVAWRRGEAKAVARRVKELIDSGEAEPGEIVLLFAAGTDAEQYEEALRELDLPTYRATGRGYFGQQQVVDLLGYLRLLHNRYDDEALVTVLASPFVGVSNDGLVPSAPRGDAAGRSSPGWRRGCPRALSERDARLLQAFRQRYDRLAAIAGTRRARAALRADRRRARLRPRRARAVGRPPPLREPAQARAARPLVRGAARPRRRGLRPLRAPSRTPPASRSSRRSRRRRAQARCGC